jgi:alkylation response protein AidB-like acyl-CoA dehydrogenase
MASRSQAAEAANVVLDTAGDNVDSNGLYWRMDITTSATPRSIEAMASHLTEILRHQEAWHPVVLRAHEELTGWAGLDLPLRHGGTAWGAGDMARLFRLCGRRDAELRDLLGAGHARLLALAPTRRFDSVLRAVAQSAAYCAIAVTEPDVGSDLRALATIARPVDGGYVLDGTKQHISRINECTHFIVFAAVKRATKNSSITAFLVSRDAAGLETEPMRPSGLGAVVWGRIFLRQVNIPVASRIGGEGQGLSLFKRHFCYWRTMMAALAIGSAQAAIDQTAARMKTRHAFGGPIGRFSHLQQAIAHWIARLRMAWLLVENVADQIDAYVWPATDAAMVKAEALEAAIGATEWAMTVFGGAGYDAATGLEKRHRDLLGLRIADGTTDVLRSQVARAFLGERLYELSLNRSPTGEYGGDTQSRRIW